ncbi:MAG: hypothetical protein GYA18_00310 [Chloroflexi bacterium]|nr:hypothetical protein [Chloroflexota bacterium]
MIKKIMEEIRRDHGVVVLNDLAARLDMEPQALAGILQTITRLQGSGGKNALPLCSRGSCAGCSLLNSHSNGVCGYRTVARLSLRK